MYGAEKEFQAVWNRYSGNSWKKLKEFKFYFFMLETSVNTRRDAQDANQNVT